MNAACSVLEGLGLLSVVTRRGGGRGTGRDSLEVPSSATRHQGNLREVALSSVRWVQWWCPLCGECRWH